MWLETIWMDVRSALRAMRKSPGTMAAAVLSLALGIGATTAIFSVMDALNFRPLPVKDPQQLVVMARPNDGPYATYRLWQHIRDQQDILSGVFAYMQTTFTLANRGEGRSILGTYVSGDYFSTLGVSAIRGRTLLPSDDVRNGPLVCVISYRFWQRHFALATDVIGKTLSLDGQSFEVVGVTPPSFFGINVGETFDVMAPLESERIVDARKSAINATSYWWERPRVGSSLDADSLCMIVAGRLKPGIDSERASARLRVLAPSIHRAAISPGAEDILHLLHKTLVAEPIPTGISLTRSLHSTAIMMMTFMAGIVLVIACANLANLMYARVTTRRRELATRLALGAGRWRLVRHALVESIALSVMGAGSGIVIAHWGAKLLGLAIYTNMTGDLGANGNLNLPFDARFFWFPALAAILSALLIGLGPGLHAAQMTPYLAMKSGQASLATRRDRSRSLLVIAQVALSMTVLVGAGLLVRTVQKLMAQELGYDPEGVLAISASLANGDDSPERQAFDAGELLSELRAMPGVVSAARSASTHSNSMKPNVLIQRPGGSESRIMSAFVLTSSEYFKTLHIPLFAGRDFSQDDSAASPAVAILSESAARRFFPGMNPLGLNFSHIDETGQQSSIQVVGVVKDVKELVRSSGQPYPIIYRPIAQCSLPCPSFGTYELRFAGPLANIQARAKAAAISVDPHLALEFSLESADSGYHREQVSARLATLFGLLALVLAAVGVYGVTSYATAQRTKEIGLRMALGAQRHDVLRLIVGESLRVVLVGIAVGALGAFTASGLIQEMLFEVSPADPISFTLAAALMATIALIAALLPAYRALKTDPIIALRAE